MEKKKSKIKLVAIISILIVIVGIIMIVVKGFNFDLKYQDSKRIILSIGQTFDNKDIKEITDEVFGNQPVMIQKVEVFEDAVSITSRDITDEQKADLINKLSTIAHTRGRDIIKPYIVPFIIATVIIAVYMMIRYYRLNSIKVLAKTIGIVIYTQVMLFSIIAITRIPIGRLTIPMVLTVYILTLFACASGFENKLKAKKLEENKSKK